MENRRLEGRARIMKKLRTNQDFVMPNNLSPVTDKWTKWHQERANNNELTQDTSASKNKRYLMIVR